MPSSGSEAEDAATATSQSFGAFRLFFDTERWEWSDDVARMHGYAPGEVVPTTELILAHKHPDDAPAVRESVRRILADREPFSSRHRIVDTAGSVHHIIVIADRMLAEDREVIGTEGYYIDITETVESEVRQSLSETMPDVIASREDIDRAKGVLMFAYGVSADRAFDILRWRSQETKGMITDRDIVTSVVARGHDPERISAGELAQGEAVTIGADDDTSELLATMADHQVRRVPVIDGRILVGIIAQADIARALPDDRVGDLVAAVSFD